MTRLRARLAEFNDTIRAREYRRPKLLKIIETLKAITNAHKGITS